MKIEITNDRDFNAVKKIIKSVMQSKSGLNCETAIKKAIREDAFLSASQDAMIEFLDATQNNLSPEQIKWIEEQGEFLASWMCCYEGEDY